MSSIDEEKNIHYAEHAYFVDRASSPDKTPQDVFVDDADHDIKYKTLSWQVCDSLVLQPLI